MLLVLKWGNTSGEANGSVWAGEDGEEGISPRGSWLGFKFPEMFAVDAVCVIFFLFML